MSRPEPRPDRPPIEVRIRDLDKIREQTPLRVEPRQLGWGVILSGAVVAGAFAGGYLLGTGALDRHAPPRTRPGSEVAVEAGPGTDPTAPAPVETPPTPALTSPVATTGSVVPMPDEPEASETPVPAGEAHAPDVPRPSVERADASRDDATVSRPVPPPSPPEASPPVEPPPGVADPPPGPRAPDDAARPAPRRPSAPWVRAIGIPPPWPAVLQSNPRARCSRLSPESDCPPEAVSNPPPPGETEAPPEGPAVPEPPPPAERATVPAAGAPTVADPPPSAPAARSAPPPKAARRYQVQVRAYQDPAAAKEFLASLTRMGYPARLVRFVDAQGRRWLRIRIGDYNSRVAAQAFAQRFNQQHGEQAVVVEAP